LIYLAKNQFIWQKIYSLTTNPPHPPLLSPPQQTVHPLGFSEEEAAHYILAELALAPMALLPKLKHHQSTFDETNKKGLSMWEVSYMGLKSLSLPLN
jgi:hypothetical protein